MMAERRQGAETALSSAKCLQQGYFNTEIHVLPPRHPTKTAIAPCPQGENIVVL